MSQLPNSGFRPTGSQPTGFQPTGFQPTGFQPSTFQPSGFQPAGSPSGMAMGAFVCGILTWFVAPLILAIVAIVIGNMEISSIDRGLSPEAGRSYAQWGRILGYVHLVVFGLVVVAFILMFTVFGFAATHALAH